jgi:hypothetical protein
MTGADGDGITIHVGGATRVDNRGFSAERKRALAIVKDRFPRVRIKRHWLDTIGSQNIKIDPATGDVKITLVP